MHSADYTFDNKHGVAIWLLSDLHIGHVSFEREKFERHLATAKQARAKVALLGDGLEAVTTGSKVANLGGQFEQTISIGDQEDVLVDYLAGLRVLVAQDGNHERRVWRVTGTSPTRSIARRFSAQQQHRCRYFQHGGYLNIKVGKQVYRLVVHHGEGGPTTTFRYLMRDFPGGDGYFCGHTHELYQLEGMVHDPSGSPRTVYCARTGSYLHLPSYQQDRVSTYGIPATGSWLLHLSQDKHELRLESMDKRKLTR